MIERPREIEAAFPAQEPPEGRVRFETMRTEMVRNLMAPGNRPVPLQGTEDMALDLGSRRAGGGQ